MEGNFTGRKSDPERTDKLPILTDDNLLKLEASRPPAGTDEQASLRSSLAELRQALEKEALRSGQLESRLDAHDQTITQLKAELELESQRRTADAAARHAEQAKPQVTQEIIRKVQLALRALHERILALETYIAGRPEGWREMEQALHSKSLRIAEAETQLAEKIKLLAKEITDEDPETDHQPATEDCDGVLSQPEPETHPDPDAPADSAASLPAASGSAAPVDTPDPSKPGRVPALVGLSPEAPIACAIDKDAVTIGRDPDCDIPLLAESVSRHHAIVTREGQQAFIEDRSSTNGVLVNNVRVQRKALTNGDEITIGKARFRFVSGDC